MCTPKRVLCTDAQALPMPSDGRAVRSLADRLSGKDPMVSEERVHGFLELAALKPSAKPTERINRGA